MTRYSTAPVEDILPLLDGSHKKVTIGDKTVKARGLRSRTFFVHGTSCFKCGAKGTYFAIERPKHRRAKPQLNLYALRGTEEVRMDRRYIVKPEDGGVHDPSNTEPFCEVCLALKEPKTSIKVKRSELIKEALVAYPGSEATKTYLRHSLVTLEEGIAAVNLEKEMKKGLHRVEFNGQLVNTGSLRLHTFKAHGTDCVTCEAKGAFFAIEAHWSSIKQAKELGRPVSFHMNLYGLKNGAAVLMTKDHVIPRSKGGPDTLDNTQTMCHKCNSLKGDKIVPKVIS